MLTLLETQLLEALEAAHEHLGWIGWGDSYERECADESKLEEKIEAAIAAAEQQK